MGADLRTYALVSATLGKYCGATALTFNMHACSTLWPGVLADDLDMSAAERAEHEERRAIHFARVVRKARFTRSPSRKAARPPPGARRSARWRPRSTAAGASTARRSSRRSP